MENEITSTNQMQSDGKDWKFELLDYYTSVLSATAVLDFHYPIRWADEFMPGLKQRIEYDLNGNSVPIDAMNRKFYDIVLHIVKEISESANIEDETRRREAYYGIANYIVDSIDLIGDGK